MSFGDLSPLQARPVTLRSISPGCAGLCAEPPAGPTWGQSWLPVGSGPTLGPCPRWGGAAPLGALTGQRPAAAPGPTSGSPDWLFVSDDGAA